MGDPEGADDGTEQAWSSLPSWLSDGVELAERGAGLVAQIQTDWEQLSSAETPWTTDTIMNEVVNSWERFTPFLGDMIEHGVRAASEVLRTTWPSAGRDMATLRSSLQGPVAGATAPYVAVGEDVAERLVEGGFDSVDAVETTANLGGMWAKDMWRAVALVRRMAVPDPGAAEPSATPDDAADTTDAGPPDATDTVEAPGSP
jgi:hypothetical protein